MKKRNVKVKWKKGFIDKQRFYNYKENLNKKFNRIIKGNRHKKTVKNHNIYVWLLLGVLLLLGIGAALLSLLRTKHAEEPSLEDSTSSPLPEIETQDGREEKEAGRQMSDEAPEKEARRQIGEEAQETAQEPKAQKRAMAAGSVLYLLLILGICMVPLLFLGVRPTETTVENRTMAALPEVWTTEGFNWNVLSEAGDYFTDHFFLRQEMVSINAGIRSAAFGISPVEDVIVGENGWLYYAATLDDYQHKNSISERALFNIAHNTALMQEYTEGLGKTFVFTIAPNKNSLYGENMPKRLRYQVAEKSDAQRLLPWLVRENVNYVDLFALFGEQEETLYYARDSHWNEKGAIMVYNALLDSSGKQHETYKGAQPLQQADYFGDLGVMLFPVGGSPEVRLQYPVEDTWRYVEGEKAEDQFIRTENEKGEGNLLMYRDSFGNSLLPYMAQTFSQTVFSRQVPYAMSDLVTYEPDILIVEKVERQLPTLGKVPPIMSAPIRETEKAFVMAKSTAATVNLSREGSYWKLEGIADSACMDTDSRIYVEMDDGGGAKLYEAFCISNTDSKSGSTNDYGYILYVSETQVSGDTFHIRVITEQEEAMYVLLEGRLCALQDGLADEPVKPEWEAGAEKDEEEAVSDNNKGTDTETGTEGTALETEIERTETERTALTGTKLETDLENGTAQEEQTGADAQSAQDRTGTETQPARSQIGTGTQSIQGQTETGTQPAQNQAGTGEQPTQSQAGTGEQPTQSQAGVGAQPIQNQAGTGTQPAQARPDLESQMSQGQAETGTQMSQTQKEAQAQAQAEAQAQETAEMQAQTPVQNQGQQAVTEVSRIYMEDCGSDSGYWVITYSDGHVEYVDD